MARTELLGCLEKRDLLNESVVSVDKLLEWGRRYEEAGFVYDAVDFYEKAGAGDELKRLLAAAKEEGTCFSSPVFAESSRWSRLRRSGSRWEAARRRGGNSPSLNRLTGKAARKSRRLKRRIDPPRVGSRDESAGFSPPPP